MDAIVCIEGTLFYIGGHPSLVIPCMSYCCRNYFGCSKIYVLMVIWCEFGIFYARGLLLCWQTPYIDDMVRILYGGTNSCGGQNYTCECFNDVYVMICMGEILFNIGGHPNWQILCTIKDKFQLCYSAFPSLLHIFWEEGIVGDHYFEWVVFFIYKYVRGLDDMKLDTISQERL